MKDIFERWTQQTVKDLKRYRKEIEGQIKRIDEISRVMGVGERNLHWTQRPENKEKMKKAGRKAWMSRKGKML